MPVSVRNSIWFVALASVSIFIGVWGIPWAWHKLHEPIYTEQLKVDSKKVMDAYNADMKRLMDEAHDRIKKDHDFIQHLHVPENAPAK